MKHPSGLTLYKSMTKLGQQGKWYFCCHYRPRPSIEETISMGFFSFKKTQGNTMFFKYNTETAPPLLQPTSVEEHFYLWWKKCHSAAKLWAAILFIILRSENSQRQHCMRVQSGINTQHFCIWQRYWQQWQPFTPVVSNI